MLIDRVEIKGFRNFSSAIINFKRNTLIIGANNVGKTNLIYALRLLLDKALSLADIEPDESDFHISRRGKTAASFSITLFFSEAKEDAVLASLKGNIGDDEKFVLNIWRVEVICPIRLALVRRKMSSMWLSLDFILNI